MGAELPEAYEEAGTHWDESEAGCWNREAERRKKGGMELEIRTEPWKEWLDASASFAGLGGEKQKAVHQNAVKRIAVPAVFVMVRKDGKTAGCAYGALERGLVGIYDLHVGEKFRCQGLGRTLCQAVLQFGTENGAKEAYLVVHSQNSNAIRLYQKLNISLLYTYDFYQLEQCGYEMEDA